MSEGKHGGESKGSGCGHEEKEDEAKYPPVIARFVEFSISEGIPNLSRKFADENHDGFERATEYLQSGAGYPLEWTALHEEYLSLVEGALSEFCNEEGVSEEDFFALLSESSEDDFMGAWLPGFLKLLNFEDFVRSMEGRAHVEIREGRPPTKPAKGDHWSGRWEGMFDYESREHDEMLKMMKLPWLIRKPIIAFCKVKTITAHIELGKNDCGDRTLTMTHDRGMMGQQTTCIPLTGEWVRMPGAQKSREGGETWTSIKAWMSKDELSVTTVVTSFDDEERTKPHFSSRLRVRYPA